MGEILRQDCENVDSVCVLAMGCEENAKQH